MNNNAIANKIDRIARVGIRNCSEQLNRVGVPAEVADCLNRAILCFSHAMEVQEIARKDVYLATASKWLIESKKYVRRA